MPGEEDAFYKVLHTFLTASQPISSPRHLKGRGEDLSRLTRALRSPGRHAFIYGFRGVGKTSLAQTAVFGLQEDAGHVSILASCERDSTFASVMTDVVRQAAQINPIEIKSGNSYTASLGVFGMGGSATVSPKYLDNNYRVETVSDAVATLKFLADTNGREYVVLLDEFDVLASTEEHQKFAALLKQLSDTRISVKFVICGVADSIERLFIAHESLTRQMHTEEVGQLGWQPRFDIIDDATAALGFEMDFNIKTRIALLSDGFPSFVHLVCEHVLVQAHEAGLQHVTSDAFKMGVRSAVSSADRPLKREYDDSVKKNTTRSEPVLWAVAADKHLEINIELAWQNYEEIIRQLTSEEYKLDNPLVQWTKVSKNNFSTKLNDLCKPAYGRLLEKPRRANFTFREKRMRAYARLRAENEGCRLSYDSVGPSIV